MESVHHFPHSQGSRHEGDGNKSDGWTNIDDWNPWDHFRPTDTSGEGDESKPNNESYHWESTKENQHGYSAPTASQMESLRARIAAAAKEGIAAARSHKQEFVKILEQAYVNSAPGWVQGGSKTPREEAALAEIQATIVEKETLTTDDLETLLRDLNHYREEKRSEGLGPTLDGQPHGEMDGDTSEGLTPQCETQESGEGNEDEQTVLGPDEEESEVEEEAEHVAFQT